MTHTLIEKILAEHLVQGELTPGSEIAIRIDQTLTQDVTGTMAYLELETMGIERVSVPLAVSYVDHNTAQFGPNNQNDHRYLQTMAAKLGVKFSRPGNGLKLSGKESYVLSPIIQGNPIVFSLKCKKSSLICHGIPLSFPIAPFCAIATITIISVILNYLKNNLDEN